VTEEIGRMKATHVIYLALMCELLEERYGMQFIEMCNAVQNEIILLVGHGTLEDAMQCVKRKFEDPQYSIKQGLIDAMKSPEQMS
jgi:hypothetical protein